IDDGDIYLPLGFVWSPDGKAVYFTGYSWLDPTKPGLGLGSDIYRIDIATSAVVNLTNAPSSSRGGPCLSPDGSRIAFTDYDPLALAATCATDECPVPEEILVMNSDGSGRHVAIDGYPAWSALETAGPSQLWSPDGNALPL